VALIWVVIFCITCIISVPYGMGKHSWAADPTKIYKILEIGLYNALVYMTAHLFIKMSILAFYIRVFTLNTPWFRYCIYAMGTYAACWWMGCFFSALFQCTPVSFFWQQYNVGRVPPAQGHCTVHNTNLVISSSALNTVGDIVIFALPIAMLWRLQLKRAHKAALILVFATGAFACIAGIVRLTQTLSAVKPGADTTWVTAEIYMWTAIEAGVGLICACLPIIGPLIGLLRERITSYMSHRSSRKAVHSSTGDTSGSRSLSRSAGWTPVGPGGRHGDTESATTFELQSKSQQAIMRTDEYSFESYPRSETGARPASHTIDD